MLFKLSNLNSNLALTLGYLNPALNNSVQGFLNREYSSRNPESQFNGQRIQNPVSGIRNPCRGIQNPRPSWIALHGVAIPLGSGLASQYDALPQKGERVGRVGRKREYENSS